jgi:hypothetical protein
VAKTGCAIGSKYDVAKLGTPKNAPFLANGAEIGAASGNYCLPHEDKP